MKAASPSLWTRTRSRPALLPPTLDNVSGVVLPIRTRQNVQPNDCYRTICGVAGAYVHSPTRILHTILLPISEVQSGHRTTVLLPMDSSATDWQTKQTK